MKLQLPQVTLVCIDGLRPQMSAKVIEICKSKVDFGAVKLFTHLPVDSEHRVEIMPITSLVMYSVFCLTELYKYIDTSHVLIVQTDGWILNPDKFDPAWLELDYIAPLFMQYDKVGSGGFSLRSKQIMRHAANVLPGWNGTFEDAERIQHGHCHVYEDGMLSMDKRFNNYKVATREQSATFGHGGNRNSVYFRERTFGFHRTFLNIDFETGITDIHDTSGDIKHSYDAEINKLYSEL